MEHTPLYVKIKDYIKENIKSGKLKPGDKIPSEKELSDIFNVSRITASTAIRDLVKDGIVYRIQGKGTFIADKKEENITNHSAFGFENDNDSLLKQGTHITKEAYEIKADTDLAEKLDINIDDPIYKIVRTKVIDSLVCAVEYIYLPAKLYPSLNLKDIKNTLLHDIVDEFCFLKQKKAKVYITPICISSKDANLLDIPENTPVLNWKKTTFSSEDRIVEYSENLINTTIHNFYLEFETDK